MKYQILFSGKIKKYIISLSSAENAQRVVKVKQYIPILWTFLKIENKCLIYRLVRVLIWLVHALSLDQNLVRFNNESLRHEAPDP